MRTKQLFNSRLIVLLIIIFIIFSSFTTVSSSEGNNETEPESDNSYEKENSKSHSFGHDVLIHSIEIMDYYVVPGIKYNKHFPGKKVNITVWVGNEGTKDISTPFDIQMIVIDDISETEINYEYKTKKIVNYLNVQDVVKLTFSWTPPITPPPGAQWDYSTGRHTFLINVTSLYENDDNSSNDFLTTPIIIYDPSLTPEITNTVWDSYGITETPILQHSSLGSILYINFTVNNTGNLTNFIVVEIFDFPEDWIVLPGSLPDFLNLGPKNGIDVRLRIKITENHSLALHGHDYPINLRAYSLIFPEQNDTFQFIVNIDYSPLAEFILLTDKTLPPSTHKINVTLRNIGNGRDIFTTSSEVFPGSEDWNVSIYSGMYTKLLKPNETAMITLQIKVPEKRMGSYRTIIVRAHSIQEPSYDTEDLYRFKIFVGKYCGVDLELSESVEPPIQMKAHDNHTFDVIVTNTGNAKDPTISLNVSECPEGWKVDLNTSSIPEDGLNIGNDSNIGVTVVTPERVLIGNYSITISSFAGNPQTMYDQLKTPIKIIESGELDLKAQPPSQTGNINETVQYTIIFNNSVNLIRTYDIFLSEKTEEMDGWEKLSSTHLTLEAYTSSEIEFTVTIPSDARADANPDTVTILDGYTSIITVISRDGIRNESLEITTYVNPVYDMELSVDKNTFSIIRNIGGVAITNINITNQGNVIDVFEFVMESEHS